MVGDVAGRHPLRIQAQHRVVEPRQPPGVLRHHRRRERAGPVTRDVDAHVPDIGADRLAGAAVTDVPGRRPLVPIVTEMAGHLDLERGLQHLLRQPRQQPPRTGQVHPPRAGGLDELLGQALQIRLDGRLPLNDLNAHA